MTTAVEANSLSTLTALAAHPPQYPRNPTHQQQEPLVLYIARVPGSRGRHSAQSRARSTLIVSRCFSHSDETERKSSQRRGHYQQLVLSSCGFTRGRGAAESSSRRLLEPAKWDTYRARRRRSTQAAGASTTFYRRPAALVRCLSSASAKVALARPGKETGRRAATVSKNECRKRL